MIFLISFTRSRHHPPCSYNTKFFYINRFFSVSRILYVIWLLGFIDPRHTTKVSWLILSLKFLLTCPHCICIIYLDFVKYSVTRRSGHYAPILLAPAEGLGALWANRSLWALLGAFGPLFSSRRCKRKHTQFSVKICPHRSQ